jgi:hypothetical protein
MKIIGDVQNLDYYEQQAIILIKEGINIRKEYKKSIRIEAYNQKLIAAIRCLILAGVLYES